MTWISGLLVIGLPLISMTAVAQDTLGVMSFNLRYGTAGDGENAWDHRRDIVVNAIRHAAPDVIGVQECLRFQADYLAEQLPEYAWLGLGRDADGGGEMSAIYYRRDRLQVLESGTFWLSETPGVPGSVSWDSSMARIASWACLYDRAAQRPLYLFNTHLDHRGAQARAEGARLLSRRINCLDDELTVILTGDFNARAQADEPYDILTSQGLADAWTSVAEPVGPVGTFGGFGPPNPDNTARIDWILYRGAIRPTHCETMTYEENGRYPSDHYPVLARFIWAKR